MNNYQGFYFRPAEGEQVFAVLRPETEKHSAVSGRVVDASGAAAADVPMLLFRAEDGGEYTLLCAACTDSAGCFAFGPLEPNMLYYIKLGASSLRLRELEPRG